MATTSGIGNLNNVNVDSSGKVTVSGITSGIDWNSLTNSIIAARSVPIDQLKTSISSDVKMISAYGNFQTLLGSFRDSLNLLRGAISFDGSTDTFAAKQVFTSVSRTDGTTPSAAGNVVAVTATNAAATGSHSIEVLQTATAEKIGSDSFSSTTSTLGLTDGNAFTINGTSISVSASDTLLSLRDRINAANTGTAPTGVSASIVSVSPTQNFLVLTADKTGTAITLANTTGTPLDTIGVTSGGGLKHELVHFQQAQLYADGLLDQTNKTYESARQTSSAVTLGSNGTIRFNDGTTTLDLAYTSGQSIQTLANNINGDATLQGMGISASVVTEGAQVRLKITTTGAAFTTTEVGGGSALSSLGMNNSRLLITRDTNSISDLFSGVSLNLLQAEVGTNVEIDVTPDLSTIKTGITSLVTAYNALKVFINQQTTIDPTTGAASADAVLFQSQTLKAISNQLNAVFGRDTSTNSQTFRVLADIGISFVDDTTLSDPTQRNTLQIDQTKLNNALNSSVDDVRRLFTFDFTSSNPNVSLLGFSNTTSPAVGGYTLNVGPVVTVQQTSAAVTNSTATLNDATNGIGATTSGSFVLNGTTIAYDVTTDSLDSLVTKINNAAIPSVTASVVTTAAGAKQLVIASSSSAAPVALSGDTGDLLSHLAFSVSARAVTSANIGGAADGSDNGTVTISGTTLTVTSASGAAGLQLDYNSTAAASGINLNFTVGVGAALYDIADPALDPINGSVQSEINSLADKDTQTQTRIDTLQAQVDAYRQTLITRFAQTESQLASTSSLLSSIITAFNSVKNNSNN